jgi:hypothetical protein
MSITSIFGCCFIGLVRVKINGIKTFHYSGVCNSRQAVIDRLTFLITERNDKGVTLVRSPYTESLFA